MIDWERSNLYIHSSGRKIARIGDATLNFSSDNQLIAAEVCGAFLGIYGIINYDGDADLFSVEPNAIIPLVLGPEKLLLESGPDGLVHAVGLIRDGILHFTSMYELEYSRIKNYYEQVRA